MLTNRKSWMLAKSVGLTVSVVLYLAAAAPVRAAGPTWAKDYSVAYLEGAHGVVANADGSFTAAGWTASAPGVTDIRVVRVDRLGNPVWQRTYTGPGRDEVFFVTPTSDGGFITSGLSTSFGAWGHAPLLLKFDSSGNLQWQKGYLATGREWPDAPQETADGGYVMGGAIDLGGNFIVPTVVRLDSGGNILWQKTYNLHDGFRIRQTPDGGYIGVGSYSTNSYPPSDWLVMKLDAAGEVQWVRTLGGPGNETARDVVVAPNGNFVIAGWYDGPSGDNRDVWVVSMTPEGDVAWQRSYGGAGSDYATSLRTTAEGGLLVLGQTSSFGTNPPNLWLLKLDAAGNVVWERSYDTAGGQSEEAWAAPDVPEGGLIVAAGGDAGFSGRFVLLRTAADGSISGGCADLGAPTFATVTTTTVVPVAVAAEAFGGYFSAVSTQLVRTDDTPTSSPVCPPGPPTGSDSLNLIPSSDPEANHPLWILPRYVTRTSDLVIADVTVLNRTGTWFQLSLDPNSSATLLHREGDPEAFGFLLGPFAEATFRVEFLEGQHLEFDATRTSLSAFSILGIDLIGRGIFGVRLSPEAIGSLSLRVSQELLSTIESNCGGPAAALGVAIGTVDISGAIEAGADFMRCSVTNQAVRKAIAKLITKLYDNESARRWIEIGGQTIAQIIQIIRAIEHIQLLTELAYGTFTADTEGFVRVEARR